MRCSEITSVAHSGESLRCSLVSLAGHFHSFSDARHRRSKLKSLINPAEAREALSRTTGSGGGPSRDHLPSSARDSGSSNEGLPRYRAGVPSILDTERPDPTPRPEA